MNDIAKWPSKYTLSICSVFEIIYHCDTSALLVNEHALNNIQKESDDKASAFRFFFFPYSR